MRISEALATQRPFFSFEFFPPKDDAGSRRLFDRDRGVAPVAAGLRFDYLRCGRLGARAHGRARKGDPAADRAYGRRPRHVRRRDRSELRSLFDDLARAGIENVLALARRSAAGCRVRASPGRIRARERPDRDAAAQLRILHRRGVLSREASARQRRTGDDLEHLKVKVDRRRRLLRFAAVFR